MGDAIEMHITAPMGCNRTKIERLMGILLTRYATVGNEIDVRYVSEDVGRVTASVTGVPAIAYTRIKDGLFVAFEKMVDVELTLTPCDVSVETERTLALFH